MRPRSQSLGLAQEWEMLSTAEAARLALPPPPPPAINGHRSGEQFPNAVFDLQFDSDIQILVSVRLRFVVFNIGRWTAD